MKSDKQAFWASVILHVAILFGFFFSILLEALRPKEKPHVFEMVEPPSAAAAVQQPVTQPEPLPAPDIPEIQPMEAIPDPVLPPPPPKPTPQPKPAPAAPQKRMSYEEFLRDNTVRDVSTQRQPAPSRSIDVPTINVPTISISTPTVSSNAPISPQQQSELQRYGARLKARIDSAWIKPASLGGMQFVATVSFSVSASGTLSNVRLNPSSGNGEFDASVLAAFRKVVSAGPTPTGQSHSFTMRFLMRDQ